MATPEPGIATMGLPKPKPTFTIEEYLAMERASREKHMYLDGQIYSMAGESNAHGDISVNVVGLLHGQLKGKPCRVRTKDTKVRSGPEPKPYFSSSGLFSYPDVFVFCDEPEFHDKFKDVVLNPKVVLEVLSPSTEDFDRQEKFERMKTWNTTLTDYVLIAQDRPLIDHHQRGADGAWTCQRHESLQAVVSLATIECTLPLAEVYDRVVFG